MLEIPALAAYAAAMSTDARNTARRYYEGSGRRLEDDMAALAANPQGVVVFLPRLVALMKPVEHTESQPWLRLAAPAPQADAWYIHLLVGELAWARLQARSLPPLRWLCYQRGARGSTLYRRSWARFVQQEQH